MDANASSRGTARLWPLCFNMVPDFVSFYVKHKPRFDSPSWGMVIDSV